MNKLIFIDKKISLGIVVGILLFHAIVLFTMGQAPICECGYVKFWHGIVFSSENSQHISDWYTFSHVIHGMIFFWFFGWFFRKVLKKDASIWFLLALSVIAESAWEVFENTDFIINRYRDVTISLDYYGDSIINSLGDLLATILGFFMAWRFPVYITVTLAIFLELLALYFIKDNLALNVIMLLYPIPYILNWQSGG